MFLLAMDFTTDDVLKALWSYWPHITATMGVLCVAMIAGIRRLWNQFVTFIHPYIKDFAEQSIEWVKESRALTTTMSENVPIVTENLQQQTETLSKIAEAQERHGQTLLKMETLHKESMPKLEEILTTLKAR